MSHGVIGEKSGKLAGEDLRILWDLIRILDINIRVGAWWQEFGGS